MGSNELIVIALFAVPVAVLLFLRVNATMVFLSLCLGYVVTQFLSTDLRSFVDTFMTNSAINMNTLTLGLLLGPALLTMVFRIHSVKGSKAVLNLLPAVAVGSLTVLLVVPLLSPGLSNTIASLPLWRQVEKSQSLIVGGGALISLFFLWAQRPHHDKDKKGDKHH